MTARETLTLTLMKNQSGIIKEGQQKEEKLVKKRKK